MPAEAEATCTNRAWYHEATSTRTVFDTSSVVFTITP
jgi:hypothetical protein